LFSERSIAAVGNSNEHNAEVYVVVAFDRVESQVLHSEKGGQRLTRLSFNCRFAGNSLADYWERLYGSLPAEECALSDSSVTRVIMEIQFTSQVLPPSYEYDCSRLYEFLVMSDQTYRTKIYLPSTMSWQKNSPRPFLNSPMLGGPLIVPALLSAQ
jgi:hypothetical protein